VTRVALLAAKGSPGVSTLGCAMVLARAAHGAVLVEADQHGGDLALLHGVPQSPGLAELAARTKRSDPGDGDLLAGYIRPLASGALPAVLAPIEGAAVRAALGVLADHPGLLDPPDRTLVFDLGRVDPDSPGWRWLTACDHVLLLTRTDLTGLAHAKSVADRLHEDGARAALALIEAGPYPPAEAQQVLGLPLAGVLPFHPKAARALADPQAVRAAASGRLAAGAGRLLDTLLHQHQQREVPVS
jgi:hypothetical protein